MRESGGAVQSEVVNQNENRDLANTNTNTALTNATTLERFIKKKKTGLSLPGLENTAKRCVVTVDHVGKYAFDNKKCFCYGSSASPVSGAVIIK